MTGKAFTARVSRRVLLLAGASLAALAAGQRHGAPAVAETARGERVPAIDPFAQPTTSGPSSRPTPAVGATPSVPGAPYLVPVAPDWSAVSLITAGNTARSGYRMAGVPDGLGAFGSGDGTVTVLMNHELSAGKSVTRGHGGKGAFVSRWVIDVASLEVLEGADFVEQPDRLHLWSGHGWTTARHLLAQRPARRAAKRAMAPASGVVLDRADVDMDHLCSADLAPVSAFWDGERRIGYDGHILLNGEETERRAGRAFAWVEATRAAYELPAFASGAFGVAGKPTPEWENLLANPKAGRKTVVVGNSDGGPSQIYVYIGTKTRGGSAVERAGLTNGRVWSLAVDGCVRESRDTGVGIAKSRLGKGSGAKVSLVEAGKGTSFLRPEDGAWAPRDPNVYYFATTDRNNFAAPDSLGNGADAEQVGRSRLWAVTFDDVQDIATDGSPTARIELLLDGTEGGDMFDNITVDGNGVVYLCEDTGSGRHASKIWSYDTATGTFGVVARLDPALFGDVAQKVYRPPTPPFTDDKETSGILDVTRLFEAAPWFRPGATVLLVNVQAHFGYDGAAEVGRAIYEGGQLVLLVKAPRAR